MIEAKVKVNQQVFRALVDEINERFPGFGEPETLVVIPFGMNPPEKDQTLNGYLAVSLFY